MLRNYFDVKPEDYVESDSEGEADESTKARVLSEEARQALEKALPMGTDVNAAPVSREAEERQKRIAKWSQCPSLDQTDKTKRELQMLALRTYIDPARHYKKSDWKNLPQRGVFGTYNVSADRYHQRKTKKEQSKDMFGELLLTDDRSREWTRRKSGEIADAKHNAAQYFVRPKNKKGKKKGAAKKSAKKPYQVKPSFY
ncbi:hypothetical protein KIPB_000581 [Kipferlia bialata]|uniref:Fcf2 pre-rRNA processing C-terminal domain-containing protein n=1 Tax=Kipferlia bialata TaxID=797122 RepID=A0A9K3CNQ3_9EUKA|nr:hypothetical protein KIPB_000581 [Kipferlia bialata]|eukprot:g581.t1